jgi:predicted MFS family arabinose efflux permease
MAAHVLFLAGAISIVGIAVLYISRMPELLLVGKIVNGIALGMAIATVQTYVVEVSPVKTRVIILLICIFSLVSNFYSRLSLYWLTGHSI